MQYIEPPYRYTDDAPSVFLAGGISGAAPWQMKLTAMLCPTPWAVMNPRRQDFPRGDEAAGRAQIAWEYDHLGAATLIAFWFPGEALCPITLFELGVATLQDKPILVGAHPCYARRFDVETQLRFRRPEVELVDSLEALARQITEAYPNTRMAREESLLTSAG